MVGLQQGAVDNSVSAEIARRAAKPTARWPSDGRAVPRPTVGLPAALVVDGVLEALHCIFRPRHSDAIEGKAMVENGALPEKVPLTSLKEGDTDPTHGKVIADLIAKDPGYLLYLDQDSFVWWLLERRKTARKSGTKKRDGPFVATVHRDP